MPIVQTLMDKLTKTYGPEKGKEVYYAMEASGKGPFAPGGQAPGRSRGVRGQAGRNAGGQGQAKGPRVLEEAGACPEVYSTSNHTHDHAPIA
jgi:hypothetical protein